MLLAGVQEPYFEILLRYILDVYDTPKEDLRDLAVLALKQDIREAVMTTYEQIKLEGKLEGRLEGRSEAAAAIVRRLLVKRFQVDPEGIAPLLSRLDFVQYEELSEMILEAKSLEEVLSWLEAASHN